MKFAHMEIPAMALLQQHDARRDIVCLSLCLSVCVSLTGTSTLQREPILTKLGHKDPSVI